MGIKLKFDFLLKPKFIEKHNSFDSQGTLTTDTRKLKKGDIFLGLNGENFDGGNFYQQALDQGASCLIIESREDRNQEIKEVIGNCSLIFVENSLNYLQELSHLYRKQWGGKIIGITGSNGKTTTKEILAHLLGSVLGEKLYFTKGNFNNHIGVPFSLLELETHHEWAIIEMGTNHFGEIQKLCEIADPDYGFITNIGASHLEFLGDERGVFKEKTALYHWVKEKGEKRFVLNSDDKYLRELKNEKSIIISGADGEYKCEIYEDKLVLNGEVFENQNLLGPIILKIYRWPYHWPNIFFQKRTSKRVLLVLDPIPTDPAGLKKTGNEFF